MTPPQAVIAVLRRDFVAGPEQRAIHARLAPIDAVGAVRRARRSQAGRFSEPALGCGPSFGDDAVAGPALGLIGFGSDSQPCLVRIGRLRVSPVCSLRLRELGERRPHCGLELPSGLQREASSHSRLRTLQL